MPTKRKRGRLSGVNRAALTAFYRKEVSGHAANIPNFRRFGRKRKLKEKGKIRKRLEPQFELALNLLPGLKRHLRRMKRKNCVQGEDRRVLRLLWKFSEALLKELR
jgi:hypothetical protein